MISHIFLIAMSIISGIACIVLILINILYDYCSETTNATIIEVEIKNKYVDSTYDKQLAFDYIYEYTDSYGKKFTGRIIKNFSLKEFSKGDVISVHYIKKFPAFSLYKKIPIIPYILLTMAVMLFIINLII